MSATTANLPLIAVVAALTVGVALLATIAPLVAVWIVLAAAGAAGVWLGWFTTHG
jgi:hypothetical protein